MNSVFEIKDLFSEAEWNAIASDLALSKRQGQIIRGILSGCSDKQVAKELDIAIPTVRTHLTRIFAKYNLQDRNELVLFIFRNFRNSELRKARKSG